MNKLGEIIKDARLNKGISQRKLARIIHVDNSGLAKIENGRVKKPGYIILRRLSKELELDFRVLLELSGYNKSELNKLGIAKITVYEGMEDSEVINQYKSQLENGKSEINIIKVLNGYKKEKLNVGETIGLMMYLTGFPFDEYIPKSDIEKYKIRNFINEWDEKN